MKVEFLRPDLPASARQPCAAPIALPQRDLSAAEVTGAWGQDRHALRVCEARRSALVATVDGAKP